jgi:methionyl-tRNA synthetase
LEKIMSTYITTSIPYVNAQPHVGFALELIIADVIARSARRRGSQVRFLNGTDDNSLKNALAAEAAGLPCEQFVRTYGDRFEALNPLLNIASDDFIRTASDPRHAPAVERLWNAVAANGDLYQKAYTGLYCVGCEQFYRKEELVDGVCPEHVLPPETVSEHNYFFRLSRYQDQLIELIETDELRIRPAHRRNEILKFLEQPLEDLSVSRSRTRAHGWGIPVPGDPGQVVYVWFDALANYISALGYASDDPAFCQFWSDADQIVHVVGKGVTRFHAVYWPAILLAAGLRVPTDLWVHGYLTVEGQKISKSLGNTITPETAQEYFGTDALRYYLLRHIGSHRDGDFSAERLREVYVSELANQFGNLVSRTIGLIGRYGRPGCVTCELTVGLAGEVQAAIDGYEVHLGLVAVWQAIEQVNGHISTSQPWKLAKAGDLDATHRVLGQVIGAIESILDALDVYLPDTTRAARKRLSELDASPLFPREEVRA